MSSFKRAPKAERIVPDAPIEVAESSAVATPLSNTLARLLELSHQLGREERKLSLLGEGNVSVRASPRTFLVKASGSNLGGLTAAQVTECRFASLLSLLDADGLSDEEIDRELLAARTDSAAQKPSVESIFHAYLLSLPGVNFVGHTHPVAVGQVLCSKYGRLFARQRLFPDQVVCCGPESVYVGYADPGLKLAQAIRLAVTAFAARASPPRVILLENHGFIALGATAEAVLATTLMGNKAAEIFVGAAAVNGGRPRFLSRAEVDRIAGRRDEHHRQRQLGLLTSSR